MGKVRVMLSLQDREWDSFFIKDIFDEVERGKRLKKGDHIVGDRPYVSSTALNNGVDGFIGNTTKIRVFSDCLSLANSGSVGSCFYEPFEFIASDHVTHLRKSGMSYRQYLFMASMLSRLSEKYNFNREINDERISREKIFLPIDSKGNPDFDFMESYVKEIEEVKREEYKEFCKAKLVELGSYKKEIDEIEPKWDAIPIPELFKVFQPGKGKGLNHLKIVNEGISYIGATNRNNGVLCYVEDNKDSHKMIQKGNCIGFIKNGDGSAGYAIYKQEDFISTSDVIYGYADWLNLYTGLYFVGAQDMIKPKYSHGYKRNQEHLNGDKVMLPIKKNGKPDFEYMEQVVKNSMIKKYTQYLKYAEKY